jgi:hypothetical protein
MNTYIDIETIPEQAEEEAKARIAEIIEAPAKMTTAETIANWHNGAGKYAGVKDGVIEKAYRSTSFDGAKGEIASIAWAINDGEICGLTRDYKEAGSEAVMIAAALAQMSSQLAGSTMQQPVFIGHHVAGFDLKFLFHRCVILGIEPPFNLPFDGKHGNQFFDNMQAWAGYRDKISQDNLCKALGIEGKPSDIDGSKVWDFIRAGKADKVLEYNKDDANKARQIHKRLTWVK